MPNTVLLRLPATAEADTEWLAIDESGAPSTAKQRGPLSLAAAAARSAKVVVLAPATHVLLAEPELPPGSGTRLSRAVPFALEEQLTEDIDQLVFALGRRRGGGGTPVAVVSRAVLQGWVTELAAAGIEPVGLYADISLMPENPGQTVLWLEKSRLAVRRPGALPFAVELNPVTEALIVAGVIADPLTDPAGLERAGRESAILYVTREDWTLVQEEFEGLIDKFESLKIQLLPDGPLPWFARDLPSTEAVNLLQGEFARTPDYGARWHRWRLVAALAVALLVVHVGAQALQIHQAKRESAKLDGEISQLFATAMPADAMQDPRRQMQQRLERIRHSGAGPEHFLHALQALSTSLTAVPKTSIDALSYREQSLDMQISAPSLAALSDLSQRVDSQGLSAEIQSSTPTATGVQAHVQVRTQGSKAHR